MPRKVEYSNSEEPVTDEQIVAILQQAEKANKLSPKFAVSTTSPKPASTAGGSASAMLPQTKPLACASWKKKMLASSGCKELLKKGGDDRVQAQRDNVDYAQKRGLSQRRACHLLEVARSTARYLPRPEREELLLEELQQLKGQYPRFGIPRVHALLRRKEKNTDQAVNHKPINHKRVQRLWHKRGLQMPQRPKKRKIGFSQI